MPPDVLLTVAFGSVCGSLFHLVSRERRLRKLLTTVAVGIVGFALGHFLGWQANLDIATLGSLHAIEGFAMSFVLLLVARWLNL